MFWALIWERRDWTCAESSVRGTEPGDRDALGCDQLTDEILRSGGRLAYEVEVLRGETIGLSETLTEFCCYLGLLPTRLRSLARPLLVRFRARLPARAPGRQQAQITTKHLLSQQIRST
jgi:hypothetical protein